MRSTNIGFLEVDVIGRYIDKNLFSSDRILAFLYTMIISMSEHTHNRHTRVEGSWGG